MKLVAKNKFQLTECYLVAGLSRRHCAGSWSEYWDCQGTSEAGGQDMEGEMEGEVCICVCVIFVYSSCYLNHIKDGSCMSST